MPFRNIFQDFESDALGDLAGTYFNVTGGASVPQIVNSPLDAGLGPPSGTKMCRVNFETGSPQQSVMDFDLGSNWDGSDEVFIRFKFRPDADVPANAVGIHIFRVFTSSPATSIYFGGNFGGDMTWQALVEGVTVTASAAINGIGQITDSSAWHTYELYMKQSATTHLTAWMNGSIMSDGGGDTSDASGFTWTSKPPTFFFTSNWSGGGSPPDDNNHWYIKDVEVFSNVTRSLGSWDESTTGFMSDATIQASGGPAPLRCCTVADLQGLSGTEAAIALAVMNPQMSRRQLLALGATLAVGKVLKW